MEKEIYKLYYDGKRVKIEISNYGNVKRNGIQLELDYNQRYLYWGSGYIHRAVAELFVPNPNNYTQVDHIDGNKHNNIYTNLRWCTRSMNMNNPITKQAQHQGMLGHVISNETKNKISVSVANYHRNKKN